MNRSLTIKSIAEFKEKDKDQGVDRHYLYFNANSSHFVTKKQEVDIIFSPYWQRMLFLDGCLQSSTRDEIIYHNALVHPLMETLEDKSNILILGGGEGATAREVLRWSKVKGVVMVDYDKQLVDHMRVHCDDWACSAFNSKRLTVMYRDAWDFIRVAMPYNGVIVDLTDPDLSLGKHRWEELLRNVLISVRPKKGGFVMNAGFYKPWDTSKLREIVSIIRGLCLVNRDFKYYVYTTFVPSFNGEWAFIVVAHRQKFMIEPEFSKVIPQWIRRGIKILPDELIERSVSTEPDLSVIDM